MLDAGDKSALILEDDVDIEFDFNNLWKTIERVLPDNWDMIFLGHCWGQELLRERFQPDLASKN
jgi:GR25 family glycosyltransferase involved in LPS biosynthesis